MVHAVTPEESWLQMLGDIPAWSPPLLSTVVIAPHPDDETLAAGGIIASLRSQGISVRVAAVTDGEMAYLDAEGAGEAGLAAVREREQAAALATLGVPPESILRLRLPDSSVGAYEAAIVEALLPYVFRDTHVIAPWPRDFHPDHEACGRAAQALQERTGARLTFWFFWTWHRGEPSMLEAADLRRFVLSEAEMRAKREALLCHRSQLEHVSGEPILPVDLLGPAERPFEVFLPWRGEPA